MSGTQDAAVPEELVLPPDLGAVRQGRRFVQARCEDLGVAPDTCDTAVLLASELITNAFIHGRSEARVRVRTTAQVVRVEVADENSRHPQLVPEDTEALDGRGLTILELLAQAWGVVDEPYGKRVWFALRR